MLVNTAKQFCSASPDFAAKRPYRIKDRAIYCANRKAGARLGAATVALRRAADPAYDAQYRAQRSAAGKKRMEMFHALRKKDPETDRRFRALCSAGGEAAQSLAERRRREFGPGLAVQTSEKRSYRIKDPGAYREARRDAAQLASQTIRQKRAADPSYNARFQAMAVARGLASGRAAADRPASDPEYAAQYMEACRARGLASQDTMRRRSAADPLYAAQLLKRRQAGAEALNELIAQQRAADPEYDAKYRRSRSAGGLVGGREAQARVAARRASDPEFDSYIRELRRESGRTGQRMIRERRANDPTFDRMWRSTRVCSGQRYRAILAAAESSDSCSELSRHFQEEYYRERLPRLVLHYAVAGQDYRSLGPYSKVGILYGGLFQPSSGSICEGSELLVRPSEDESMRILE